MDTHKLFSFKSFFNFIDEQLTLDVVQRTMMKVCSFLWALLWGFLSSSFRHLIEYLARSRFKDEGHEKSLDTIVGFHEQEERIARSSNCSTFGEEDEPGFTFGFKFQIKEEDLMSYKRLTDSETSKKENLFMENEMKTTTSSTSKYEFVPVHGYGGFVAEPESASFTVHELFLDESSQEDEEEDDFIIKKRGTIQNLDKEEEPTIKDQQKELKLPSNGKKVNEFMESEASQDQILQSVDLDLNLPNINSINSEEQSNEFVTDSQETQESQEKSSLNSAKNGGSGSGSGSGSGFQQSNEFVTDYKETQESHEKSSLNSGKNGGSGSGFQQSNEFVTDSQETQESHEKRSLNSAKNGGLEVEKGNWLGEFLMKMDNFSHDSHDHHVLESQDSIDGFFSITPEDLDSISMEFESVIPPVSEEIDDEYIELKPHVYDQPNSDSNVDFESDSHLQTSKESETKEEGNVRSWEFDSDEEDEDDVLLEHQELVDQMKMELKNARTGGLPTILEESETPRLKEDLQPLKITEKVEHRDLMAEIQKFYKSYSEKMRKLDVLNYQTLQAINFLRMKHPDQMNTGENASLSALKSVVFPSFWPCKLRRIYADPTLKSITELHKDLEIVYVGQACLSWEILHWQYKKAKELQLYDPQGFRSYNQVAIEFQQFHVLLRRFTEDEMFQGPRVQNYAKQRCLLRGLLQVPAIRDDNLKEKKARKEEEGEAVLISTMAKMIKESMTVFWEFLHTDKDTTNLFLTIILQGSKAHLQDPSDSELFMDTKTRHQKKEKRLKDLLRTGNCIVKKFQKQQETILDQHMFVSQVELRLVSRVLSLPRLSREQLVWCQSKLNNIKFIDRKVRVEDSLFLLFPC